MNRNVFLLGLVSLLNDVSSEMISAVLPFLIMELGGGGVAIGLVAGFKETLSNVLKVLSGYLSDRSEKKKPFIFAGYLVSSIFKLVLGFSKSPLQLFLAVFLERLGKGIRTAPRDALISLYGRTGRNFGIHRAMDTAGALIGVLLVLLLISLHFKNRNIVFAAAVLSFLSLLPLFAVKEPEKVRKTEKRNLEKLPEGFWKFLAVASLFGFSSVSFMFLIAVAEKLTGSRLEAVVFYLVLNVAYVVTAYPTGVILDKIAAQKVTAFGYLILGISLLCLSFGELPPFLAVSFILYGVASGVTDTAQRVLIAKITGKEKRGLAYGLFHGITGGAVIIGNVLAGKFWNVLGIQAFSFFGITAVLSGLLLRFCKLKV